MTGTPVYKNGVLQDMFLQYIAAALAPLDGTGPLEDLSTIPVHQYLSMEDSFYAGAQAFMLQILSENSNQHLLTKLQDELASFGENIEARYSDAMRGKGS
jgi:hypothetical protein